jgi:hypothetical protein
VYVPKGLDATALAGLQEQMELRLRALQERARDELGKT